MPARQRFRSALFGLALGDAWGYPYLQPPQPDRTPLAERLIISDVTQMSLALTTAMHRIDREDLTRRKGMRAIAEEFLAYHQDRDYYRYSGNATDDALSRLQEQGLDAWEHVASNSGGACAVMRLAPAALLAPSSTGVGWSVMQASLTHNSGVVRAASAVLGCVFTASRGRDLVDVASGLAGDRHLDEDTVLTDAEKSALIEDLHSAEVRGPRGDKTSLDELIDRVQEARRVISPILGEGDFEELYRDAKKFQLIFGLGWDAGSCTAGALLLAQLYLDHEDQYDPHDFLHVAVNWPGNRNIRASLTGALIGAHMQDASRWDTARDYRFEPRYNAAIHSGVWKGFGAASGV